MTDTKRLVIRESVLDVLTMLENEPVEGDMFIHLTAVRTLNRISLAHLSIERAIKYLITAAGADYKRKHDLKNRYEELIQCDPDSAAFLSQAFQAAVKHYNYNPDEKPMAHLTSLPRYLQDTASDAIFNEIRYWEFDQDTDSAILQTIILWIHMELLHALSEILLEAQRSKETVKHRVDRAVQEAMHPSNQLTYSPGSRRESLVRRYLDWRNSHESPTHALKHAAESQFEVGDDYSSSIVKTAHQSLLRASDPAVKYFAKFLSVLPKQQTDILAEVRWLESGDTPRAEVTSPSGICLGYIYRNWDGRWYIVPMRSGPPGPSAKAANRTDAIAYLSTLLSKPALATVNGEERHLRVIQQSHTAFPARKDLTTPENDGDTDLDSRMHEVTFWQLDHGIKPGDDMSIDVLENENHDSPQPRDVLRGKVLEVTGSSILVSGRSATKIGSA